MEHCPICIVFHKEVCEVLCISHDIQSPKLTLWLESQEINDVCLSVVFTSLFDRQIIEHLCYCTLHSSHNSFYEMLLSVTAWPCKQNSMWKKSRSNPSNCFNRGLQEKLRCCNNAELRDFCLYDKFRVLKRLLIHHFQIASKLKQQLIVKFGGKSRWNNVFGHLLAMVSQQLMLALSHLDANISIFTQNLLFPSSKSFRKVRILFNVKLHWPFCQIPLIYFASSALRNMTSWEHPTWIVLS